jgi:hypothetical protein
VAFPFWSQTRIYQFDVFVVICRLVVLVTPFTSSFDWGEGFPIPTFTPETISVPDQRLSASRAFFTFQSVEVIPVFTSILFIYVINKPLFGSPAGAAGQVIIA